MLCGRGGGIARYTKHLASRLVDHSSRGFRPSHLAVGDGQRECLWHHIEDKNVDVVDQLCLRVRARGAARDSAWPAAIKQLLGHLLDWIGVLYIGSGIKGHVDMKASAQIAAVPVCTLHMRVCVCVRVCMCVSVCVWVCVCAL